jgi:hypothetical protein
MLGIIAQIMSLDQIVGNEISLTLSLSNVKELAESFLRFIHTPFYNIYIIYSFLKLFY